MLQIQNKAGNQFWQRPDARSNKEKIVDSLAPVRLLTLVRPIAFDLGSNKRCTGRAARLSFLLFFEPSALESPGL